MRTPTSWLAVAAWVVIGCSILTVFSFAFGRDQSIYAQVASTITLGGMPYRDAWDFKPPGVFLVYAAAEAFFGPLFGKAMWSVRIVEGFGLLGMVFAFRRFATVCFGDSTVGLVGGAIAVLLHAELEFWHTGQPESFGGMLTAAALVLCVAEPEARRRRVAQWLGVGALFGFAFLLKPPLGGGALVCGLHLARRERFERGSVPAGFAALSGVAFGSLLTIGVVAAWFFLKGAWSDLSWTLFEFTPGYTKLGWDRGPVLAGFYYASMELLWKFSALPIAGTFLALVWKPIHEREREGLFLLGGVMSIQLVGVVMQGKYFQYHYGATLPLVSLVAGLGFVKLWNRAQRSGPRALLAYAGGLVLLASLRTAVRDLPGTFWERSIDRAATFLRLPNREARAALDARLYRVADYDLGSNREVASAVADLTPEGARIFVWGFEPSIYWLSGRRPASRFIYDVPQRVSWERDHARRVLLDELSTHPEGPPRVFVVQHGDVFPYVTGDSLDSHASLETFPALLSFVDTRYDKLRTIQDFDLYVLRDAPNL